MRLAQIRHRGRMTSLSLALARGVGLSLPRRAYFLDFTVPLSNPKTCIFCALSYLSDSSLAGSRLKVSDVSLTGSLTRKLSSTITPQIPQNDSFIAYFGILPQTATDSCSPGFAASFALAPGRFTSTMAPSGKILNNLAPFSSGGRMTPKWRKQTEISRALKTSINE